MQTWSDRNWAVARHHGSGRISAILPEPIQARGSASLQLLDANGGPLDEPVTAALRANGDYAHLRARINPWLPPGIYAADLHAADGVRRIAIQVDPIVALRVDPPVLVFAGEPGAPLQASIVIANQGNVPAELPDYGAVGIYQVNGIETAIGRAYRSDAEEGLQTLSRFVEELRNGYGGLLKLRIEGAKGPLPPGKACGLTITAKVSERVRAGRVYTGRWPFFNLNYAVRVQVGDEPATQPSLTLPSQ